MAKSKGLTAELMRVLELTDNSALKKELEESDILSDIALAFLDYRIKHGLSQVQMAEIIGVSQPMVVKLESGDNNPTVKQLAEICRKLRLNLIVKIAEESKPTIKGYYSRLVSSETQNYIYNNREVCSA